MNLLRRVLGAISPVADEAEPVQVPVLAPPAVAARAPDPEGFAEAAAHADAGREREAERLFRKVLAANPGHGGTMNRIGLLCAASGRHDEARRMLVDAVRAEVSVPGYHLDLAEFHLSRGMSADAAHACLEGLALAPHLPRAHHVMALAFARRGLAAEAEARERRAIQLDPGFAAAHLGLGEVLLRQGRFEESAASFRAGLAMGPRPPRAVGQLCVALAMAGRDDDASAELAAALEGLRDADSLNAFGGMLLDAELGAAAATCFERALRAEPRHLHARLNLGLARVAQLDLDGAAEDYSAALRAQPASPHGRLNRAILMLKRGEWERGWREFEWRYRLPEPGRPRARPLRQPLWRGEAARGKTLLIHAEDGLGDTIQFVRYAPLAAARGLRVIVEAQKPLVGLLRGLEGVEAVVADGESLPRFDLHCPTLSLPIAFGTTPENVPDAPYLAADPALAAAWGRRLERLPRGRRVGLAWSGNPANLKDHVRSLPPELLRPLLAARGARFVSLQKGGAPLPEGAEVTDLMADVADFSDTAAVIENLDLVISVDTSVAHLAGAMGKPVWLLNRYNGCWRWLAGRADSPWYPSMRVFSQPRPGDWRSVVAEVTAELDKR
jgi:Tfp pilus assembly protein PilF